MLSNHKKDPSYRLAGVVLVGKSKTCSDEYLDFRPKKKKGDGLVIDKAGGGCLKNCSVFSM
jgi:hypothetical protein